MLALSPKARPLSKAHSRRAFSVVDPAFGHLATTRRWPHHRQRSVGRRRPRLPVDAQSANLCRDVARISTKPKAAADRSDFRRAQTPFTNGWVSMSSRSGVILSSSRSTADQLGHANPR
jgi:hypothetical protein